MTDIWLQALPRDHGKGVRFDLGAPTPAMVDFDAMATVLARIPRFIGHTERGVYSVAQHCREGAYALLRLTSRRDWAAAFLLHDGHEYVMGDMAIPVRDAICYFAVRETGDLAAADTVKLAVKALKGALDAAIYTAAGIAWPLPIETQQIIKAMDVRMLRTERDARLAEPPEAWAHEYENAVPLDTSDQGVDLDPWLQSDAEAAFRIACEDLLPVFAGQPDEMPWRV